MNNKTTTCNEAIVLLRIYRGSFNGKPRKGTDGRDLNALLFKKLIEHPDDDGAFYCTTLGNETVAKIFKVIDGRLIDQ